MVRGISCSIGLPTKLTLLKMYEDSDNEEGYHDEDDDLEEIRGEAERNRRNVQQPIRNQVPPMRAAPPQVIPQAGWGLGRAAIQHMLGNFASGGGHPFARPSASLFRSDYKAWSTSIHEAGQGRLERIDGGRQNLMFGGNSALLTYLGGKNNA